MDQDNKREITISIPESIYEELHGAGYDLYLLYESSA